MLNSNMPNIPGMGAMTDTLEFVKNLWGGMGVPGVNIPGMTMPGMLTPGMNMPGMVMPTLSVEEIRKRITDLKAVESWLELNMNMLRATIQALEVQAATLATLQSMGDAMNATMQAGAQAAANVVKDSTASTAGKASDQPGTTQTQNTSATSGQADAAALAAPLVNAAAWWNMLQDQFRQAVTTAMTQQPEGNTSGNTAGNNSERPATTDDNRASDPPETTRKRKSPTK